MAKRARSMSRKRSAVSRRFKRARKAPIRGRQSRRRNISLNMHRFSRYTAATTSVIDSLEFAQGFEYKFSDILSSAEFTTLFDRYKVDRVVNTFQLVNNPDAAAYLNDKDTGNSANFYPKMWYIRDYDDSVAESSSTLKERVGVKCVILQPNKVVRVTTKPAIATQVYRTALTTGYGPKWNQWIDCAMTDVPHYGLKVAYDCNGFDPADTRPFRVRVETKFYFSMKDVR